MSFTCIACKVVFPVPELQREHYKSDWHRYNLKRKVAELPPVTKEAFEIRSAEHNVESQSAKQTASTCELCHKKFSSTNALANHFQSKKHIEALAKPAPPQTHKKNTPKPDVQAKTEEIETPIEEIEEVLEEDADDSDWESCDDEDEDMDDTCIPPKVCLFCSFESDSVVSNVEHMTQAHSFFIPDIEYLTDLEGLLTFLGYKVGNGYVCLWCDGKGKSFKSTLSVQKHMQDKGHCKMLHEGEALLSYADFYDYSASYPDGSQTNDDEVIMEQLQGETYELVLPSGATIGHRSLALYYKQNLKPLKPENNRKAISKVMQQYKALGWTGTSGEAAVRKAKDLSYFRKMQSKHVLKLAMKKNKLQPYLRPQVVF